MKPMDRSENKDFAPILHPDGRVSVWDTYSQRYATALAKDLNPRVLSLLSTEDRDLIMAHKPAAPEHERMRPWRGKQTVKLIEWALGLGFKPKETKSKKYLCFEHPLLEESHNLWIGRGAALRMGPLRSANHSVFLRDVEKLVSAAAHQRRNPTRRV